MTKPSTLLLRSSVLRTAFAALLALNVLGITAAKAQYCTPSYGSLCSSADFINSFSTTGGITNITNNNTGCNGNANNYIFYNTMTVTENPGGSFNISCQAGSTWGQGFGIWIDYNNNNSFLDPGEFVWNSGSSGTGVFTGTITVPLVTLPGIKRMRVRCTYASVPTDPCVNASFGEVEDYNLSVLTPAPNDLGVYNITAPVSGCGLGASEQISIQIGGYGSNSQTGFNVAYKINNGAPVVQNVGSLVVTQGTFVPFTFTVPGNFSVPGTYTIKSWTMLAGDAQVANDTSTVLVTAVPGVNTYPYFENFELSNGGWLPGGTSSSWAWGTPAKPIINAAFSGTKAYVTGGLGGGTYNPSEQSYILGPCFDLSSLTNPWFSMKIWWYCEGFWDGAVLQASTNFGTTWTTIGAVGDPNNWYNQATTVAAPGGSQNSWSGTSPTFAPFTSNGWVTAAHALTGLGGQSSVRLRIAFAGDGSVNYDGIGIDDVRIGEGPVPNLGPDQLMCGGDTVILNPGTFAAYNWSTGGQAANDTILSSNAGYIAVTVTDANGFTGVDTVLISLSNPFVNLGPDSTICPGDTLNLDGANPGGTYLWSTGDTTQIYGATTAGTFWVLVNDSVGCPATDTVVVTLAIPPVLDLGGDTTVCYNEPVFLDGGPGPFGTTWDWSTGATTQVVVITSPGTYSASVTTPGGCTAIDTVEVFALPNPALSLGPDRIECGSFTLDAGNPGSSYLWNTGATSQTISPGVAGLYVVTVTNTSNCSSVDSVTITTGTLPVVNLGPDQAVCNSQNVTLNAGNPGATYFWSNGATTQSITVNQPGTYIVEVTTAAGCTSSDTIQLIPSGLVVNLGPDQPYCPGTTVVLDAGPSGSTYQWSTGATSQTISVSGPGTYMVTVTDGLGCNATDQIVLSTGNPPTAAFTGPPSIPLNQTATFTDQSTGTVTTWSWDFGDGTSSTLQNPTHVFVAIGTFSVCLTVFDGLCESTTCNNITVGNPIGTDDEFLASGLTIYPNPSSGVFNLEINLGEATDLLTEVTDLKGQVIYRGEIQAATLQRESIDLSGYTKGIYLLKVETREGQQVIYKLVIQ